VQKIQPSEIKDLVAYEKVRDETRARVIALKKNRRLSVGSNLTFLFENRDTVLFQIQEMIRTERIVEDAKVQDEIDVYSALLPSRDELSATLFIEIPDLVRMAPDEVRTAVNRFQGIDQQGVWLVIAGERVPAVFESGHSKEEKMAAVHYVRFPLSSGARAALADTGRPAMLVVDHPRYKGEAELSPELRAELVRDLEAVSA
jgi:hypothetical protein